MNRVTRLVPVALGVSLGVALSSANAGGYDLSYTSAHNWSVESNGESHYSSVFPPGTLQFYEHTTLMTSGPTADLAFMMSAHGDPPGNVDTYHMATRTEYGWGSDAFWGAFFFNVNAGVDTAVVEYADAGYYGEHTFTPPTMEVYENMVHVGTLTNLSDTLTVSGGSQVGVKIIWTNAPMHQDGTETEAAISVYPTAVPGGGALALLGFGGVIRRRRRLS